MNLKVYKNMRTYKARIPHSLSKQGSVEFTAENIASLDGYIVNTFSELSKKCAELSCANPDVLLFYRGQCLDYKTSANKTGKSSFYPSMYRGKMNAQELSLKWRKLEAATKLLRVKLIENKIHGYARALKKNIVLWSILQHYEVTDTPLLDVSQSLRVACSFATLDTTAEFVYIYVFALPYYANRISVNSEQYLTNVRLISIVPPEALRPYQQEGFLVGEDEFDREMPINKEDLDFNRRLVYKFKIPNKEDFWGDEAKLKQDVLYPKDDVVDEICKQIKSEAFEYLTKEMNPFLYGQCIRTWSEIEQILGSTLERYFHKSYMFGKSNLEEFFGNNRNLRSNFMAARRLRNKLVHTPNEVHIDLPIIFDQLQELKKQIIEHVKLLDRVWGGDK